MDGDWYTIFGVPIFSILKSYLSHRGGEDAPQNILARRTSICSCARIQFIYTVCAQHHTTRICQHYLYGTWSNPSAWDCGHVPATGDNVIIPSAKYVTLDTNTNDIGNLTLGGILSANSYTTLRLTGNWSNTGSFMASTNSNVIFAGSGIQTLTGNTSFMGFTVASGSTLNVGSSIASGSSTIIGTLNRLAPAQNIALSTSYSFKDGTNQNAVIIQQNNGGTAMGNTTVQMNRHTTNGAFACGSTTLGGFTGASVF